MPRKVRVNIKSATTYDGKKTRAVKKALSWIKNIVIKDK